MHSEVAAGPVSGDPTADAKALRALVEVSDDGLAVLDAQGRFATVNTAGTVILGVPVDELLGRPAPFPDEDGPGTVSWRGAGGRRELAVRVAPAGEGRRAVWFSDVTGVRRREERLTAIAHAASSVADTGSLRGTLEAVAREVVETAGLTAVQILAVDDPGEELRVLGMAGFGRAEDFVDRLSACRRLGADIRFLDVLTRGATVVVPRRKPVIMDDPAWAPLHEIMDRPDWDCFVGVPLTVRGRVLGVMNAYYAPGEDPAPDALAFLAAMAAQAAVIIDTARLLSDARSRAQVDERRRMARDLHDSVVQLLFSMRLQATALGAQLDRPDADTAVVRRGAADVADLAESALTDLRRLIFELRPSELGERDLVEAVRAHARSLQARTGLLVDLVADPRIPGLEAGVEEDLLRVVHEALHNVVKHAHADVARVVIDRVGTDIAVEVSDDGTGDDGLDATDTDATDADGRPGSAGRLGLVSMRERAERWGGRLEAGPRAGGGWTVRVVLPVPTGECP